MPSGTMLASTPASTLRFEGLSAMLKRSPNPRRQRGVYCRASASRLMSILRDSEKLPFASAASATLRVGTFGAWPCIRTVASAMNHAFSQLESTAVQQRNALRLRHLSTSPVQAPNHTIERTCQRPLMSNVRPQATGPGTSASSGYTKHAGMFHVAMARIVEIGLPPVMRPHAP